MCSNCPHGIAINLLDFIRVNCSIDLLWLAKCQNFYRKYQYKYGRITHYLLN
jgi:hypothetical protein